MTANSIDRTTRVEYGAPRAAAVDVIVGSDARHRLVSVAEVLGFAILVPLVILLIGLPIAASVRAALSVVLR